jgi:PhoPQ-activated pathogenicity-related protein
MERFESLLYENSSTCDLNNQAITPDITLSIPIYRVIGKKDETWEVELGETYKDRLPNIYTITIPSAGHKDVFFRASEFYESLMEIYHPKVS